MTRLPGVGDVYDTKLEGPGCVLLCVNVRSNDFSTVFEFFMLTGSVTGSIVRTWVEGVYTLHGFTMLTAMKEFDFKRIA